MYRKVVIILAPPGGGKTTQAKLLSERTGLPHVEMSKLLKTFIKKGGELLDDALVWTQLSLWLAEQKPRHGYILDGFPRTKGQAKLFHKGVIKPLLKNAKISHIDQILKVIELQVGTAGLLQRLVKRAVKFGRHDDKPKIALKRQQIYRKNIEKINNFYKSKRLHQYQLGGYKKPQEVHDEIFGIVDSWVKSFEWRFS